MTDHDSPWWLTIHIGGNVETHLAKPGLADLQKSVRGYIAAVPRAQVGTTPVAAFVHETGEGMRPNPYATGLLASALHGQVLLGPVTLVGPGDSDGEVTPLPPAVVAYVQSYVAEACALRN